jgi:hypothetical protein
MIEPKVFSQQELAEKADRMQLFLECEYDSRNAEELIKRTEFLQILIAQSGRCLADAKWYQDKIVNGAIMESLKKAYEEKLSPSTINKFVMTAAKDYNYLVNVFDRINATATHQNESIRTIISYRKAEMQL